MGKLNGKVALVTGGNRGIGFATAKLFVEEGAHVYITGRRKDKVDEAAAKIGKGVTGVQGDVAIQADLVRLFDQVKREHGKLDIVFANAGAAEFAPFGQVDEGHFDIPDGGSIILNSSVVGTKGFNANTVYAATKAAVRSFARTWTTDLKERKIRVNVVSPGPVDTEGLNDLLGSGEVGEQRRTGVMSLVPLGRMAQPLEIAHAVLFLGSDESSYVTGTELFVDGGMGQV